MERLTKRNKSGLAMAACCGKACEYNYVCEVGGSGECKGMYNIIDKLADLEDIISNDYDVYRLKQLIEADREGRIKIIPESVGKTCGTCENFIRIEGTQRGNCRVKPLVFRKYGMHWGYPFEPAQSRKACKNYESALKAMKESEEK